MNQITLWQKFVFLPLFLLAGLTFFLMAPQAVQAATGDVYTVKTDGSSIGGPFILTAENYPTEAGMPIANCAFNRLTGFVLDSNGNVWFYHESIGDGVASEYYQHKANAIAITDAVGIACALIQDGGIHGQPVGLYKQPIVVTSTGDLYQLFVDFSPYGCHENCSWSSKINANNISGGKHIISLGYTLAMTADGNVYDFFNTLTAIYTLEAGSITWDQYSHVDVSSLGSGSPVDAGVGIGKLVTLTSNGDVYQIFAPYEDSHVLKMNQHSSFPPGGGEPIKIEGNYVLDSLGNIYWYDDRGPVHPVDYSLAAASGNRFTDFTIAMEPIWARIGGGDDLVNYYAFVEGEPSARLKVNVFNDKNNDGIIGSGEEFGPSPNPNSSFTSSIADVGLDGSTITPDKFGFYPTLISPSPYTHALAITPNKTNSWQVTNCSCAFNSGSYCSCKYLSAFSFSFILIETVEDSGSYGPITVPLGETITVNLGIIKNSPPSPPSANLLPPTVSAECSPSPLSARFTWSELEGGQSAYQIQIDNDTNLDPDPGDTTTPPIDSGEVRGSSGSSNSYSTFGLLYNARYYWRLKVWNSLGLDSGWLYPPSTTTPPGDYFTTPPHALPWPEFKCNGEDCKYIYSSPGVQVTFNDQSKCYDSSGTEYSCNTNLTLNQYLWAFGDGTTYTPTTPGSGDPPPHSFPSAGRYQVTLSITDGLRTCSKMHEVPVGLLPEWKEISPTGRANQFLASVFNYLKPLNFLLK